MPTGSVAPVRVIAVVAQRRVGPISSTTRLMAWRRSPSPLVQRRVRRVPTASTRVPEAREIAAFSAAGPQSSARRKVGVPSTHSPDCSSSLRGLWAMVKFATGRPDSR